MLLETHDVELFFRLHLALLFFVNRRLGVLPDPVTTPEELREQPPTVLAQIRDALSAHPDLIDAFCQENPSHLPDEELAIVSSWRHRVAGKFYLFRTLKKYTVFLSAEGDAVAYGVLALTQPLEDIVGANLPILVQTALLPFKGAIVYDGMLNAYRISFGPGIRRSLNEKFKAAKETRGIVTSLPPSAPAPAHAAAARPRQKAKLQSASPDVLDTITDLTDRFCRQHLNDEYAVLCRELAEKLARKRPSPLVSGQAATWASGIVRTIGWVNFLHDKSQSPYMRLGDVDAGFGIGESTGAAKMAAIRKLLKIRPLDPAWTLPSRLDDNPMVWMLQVNGLIMDIRSAPREAQEAAFRKGLIPYIPADRKR